MIVVYNIHDWVPNLVDIYTVVADKVASEDMNLYFCNLFWRVATPK